MSVLKEQSGIVSVAGQKLDQEISWTKTQGQAVSFSCKDNDQCTTFVYWYQKKEGEPFTLILDIQKGNCAVDASYNHPQKNDFSATRMNNNCDLKIQSVKVSHSATYYCACYKGIFTVYGYVFGSGTRLFVTDNTVRKPKVTVYSESNPESNVNTLICLAGDMFPDLVKISWKMEDENGRAVEVPKAEGEQLEQREEGETTSMIIIDKEKMYRNKYICSVEHEGGPQDVYMLKDKPTEAPPTTVAAPTCPFRNDTQQSQTLHLTDDSFPSTFSLNLASVVYTVMIVKSMVYCCGLSILLHHRRLGRGPSTCRHIY
ncbi:immunoglobulin lambda-1 light chain-like [Salvelinus namaycush]|uniref:immunoglobulin lambda-1 light chain-like n=1 Tax=Salvelinus namaycush TaxID=8040 RepID=UPI0019025F9E|nr:immunoglobulin lambda-1 light chain-like [Salvelinus namaycush]